MRWSFDNDVDNITTSQMMLPNIYDVSAKNK